MIGELRAALMRRREQTRVRRALFGILGSEIVRCWGARADLREASLERMTLALANGWCLEIHSTRLDCFGLQVGLKQLLAGDLAAAPAGHTRLLTDPNSFCRPSLQSQVVAACRLERDDRGDVLRLELNQSQEVAIWAEVAAGGPGGLALRLRPAHDWERSE